MSSSLSSEGLAAGEVHLEFELNAEIERVWTALTQDIEHWWPKAFYTSERSKRFVLEAKLGGMMGEVFGPGEGLIWYQVIGVDRPNSLMLSGYLLPPWAGPGISLARFALTAISETQTKLEFFDSTFGKMSSCSNEEGWQQIFSEHFKAYVEASA
ncbi:MAG: hypothetical protein HOH58_10200 [Opitutaceae bacterium]|jgi:uncharacterized protein YndB with AHSA1/START domain|nr:hypothetical protein [Opitutaceae bacterium]